MSADTPKYKAIAQYYRTKIDNGELRPGTALESRRKLARFHTTSRVTMDKVIELLTADGWLEPSDGNRPPVVANRSRRIPTVQSRVENAAANGRALGDKETSKILSVGMVPCPADIAHFLGVAIGGEVLCRERLNLVDGEPVATGRSYYPPEVTEATPELRQPVSIPSGSRELAAERMGSAQRDVVQIVTSRLASDQERELLNLADPLSAVVIQVSRTVLLVSGKTVEVALKVSDGARPISFHTTL